MHTQTSAIETLRWTPLTADTVEQWAELCNLLATVDGTEEFYEPADLVEELQEPGVTPETDTWGVWDEDRLIAYGQLRVSANLDDEGRVSARFAGGVHPDLRGRGIGREIVRRMEARGRDLAGERHPGAPAIFRADGELEGSAARRLFTHLGYAVVRHFNALARPVPGDPLTVPEIPGVQLVTSTAEHERAVHVAHVAAFADHWGSTASTEEGWHGHWSSRSSRHEVSSLAVDDRGEVLAYVLASQWVPRELYITIVGTVPQARGRGLAAACLARTLLLAGESGEYDKAELHVDSESPTGATRLYERLGFALVRTTAAMQKDA